MTAGWERLFVRDTKESSSERLGRYGRDTMHSILSMIDPGTGLPANRITLSNTSLGTPTTDTTITDIGFTMGSLVVTPDMQILPPLVAQEKVSHILSTLQTMKNVGGLFYNWYDIKTAEVTTTHHSGGEIEPFLSSVDNAWLALMLMLVREAMPELEDSADKLLSAMDFPRLYDPHENLFWGGYYPNKNTYSGYYPLYGSETRINPIVGISQFGMSPEAYTELYKRRVKSRNVILSGGGSMFEDLLPSLFVPETKWSPEWEKTVDSYISRQIYYGQKEAFGFWGLSPCDSPNGQYTEYGVHRLGTHKGYHQGKVVTPHASFLALPHAKRLALANLTRMEDTFPDLYRPGLGFADSVNVLTGQVAPTHLSLDDAMIVMSVAEANHKGVARYLEPQLEAKIKPLFLEHHA